MEYTIEVSNNNKDNKTVMLKSSGVNKISKGQKFSISLEENASTGYSWSYSADNNAIKLAK